MKLSTLFVTAALMASVGGGEALAQTMSPPVTMQPIPNPPEKAKMHAKKMKMHHMAKKTAEKAPETAGASK